MGGLGNQMFQYAMGRALSLKNKTTLKLDLKYLLDRKPKKNFVFRNYDLSIFRCNPKIATEEEVKNILGIGILRNKFINKLLPLFYRRYYTENSFEYDKNIYRLSNNTYIEGYWQSYKYFEDISEIIRADFENISEFNIHQNEISNKIKSCNSVCINVRRADFLNNSFHGVCNIDYYQKGLKYISEKVDNLNIFVFSDDILWCKSNLNFRYPTTFLDHEFAGEKFGAYLKLMTECNHFVIPNSTFGWWAAWLNDSEDKIVVAPKNWFENNEINTKDLIPKSWIRI